MDAYTDPTLTCAGHGQGTIVIDYNIPRGRQKPYHDNPGARHSSAHRIAYLPDDEDGRKLLKRKMYAFKHGLTFTVGTSLTSGATDPVTWSTIHHKTSRRGGIHCHGFPDPNYFMNCNEELDNLGIPPADQ